MNPLSVAVLAVWAIGCTPDDKASDPPPTDAAAPLMDQGGGGMADPGRPAPTDDGSASDPAADAAPEPSADAAPAPDPDMGAPSPGRARLFIIAGQSNAEGNAFYTGLELLAQNLPEGDEPLSADQRTAARALIAQSQGGWCSPEDVRHNTADTVIDQLRSTALDWRRLNLAYQHPTVRIRSRQYDYAPVVIQDADGAEVPRCEDCDEPGCDLSPADGTRVGPVLNMYTTDRLLPLAVGFGIAEDPEEGKSYGPELSFGHAIGRTHPDAIVFKMAMGGSSLGDHWRLDGPMYSTLIAGVQTALAEHDADLGGFIWFQGFNDQFESAYCDPLTPGYEGNLRAFVEAVRRDLGQPVPTVIVKARNGGNLEAIQAAQDAVASALDGVVTVETKDTSECFHYDSGAQIVIGERIAGAMVALLSR